MQGPAFLCIVHAYYMLTLTPNNYQYSNFSVFNLISIFVNEYQQLFVDWVMTTTNNALQKKFPEENLCAAKLLACTIWKHGASVHFPLQAIA